MIVKVLFQYIWDIRNWVSGMVNLEDYYPLLLFQTGS